MIGAAFRIYESAKTEVFIPSLNVRFALEIFWEFKEKNIKYNENFQLKKLYFF
jgi:hypothetical protein